MSKFKRNEPCPCGSGKKYKKCCGSPNINDVNPSFINTELSRLHQAFISFAVGNFELNINERLKAYAKPDFQDQKETLDIYNSGLTTWVMLNDPFLEGNRTIFESFLRNHSAIDNPVINDVFTSWGKTSPSVYEVKSINEDRDKFVTLVDLATNDEVYVPSDLGDEFLEGSLIVSTILPMIGQETFAYSMIRLYRHNKEKIVDLLAQYSTADGGLQVNFPDFLADALLIGSDAHNWDNVSYEDVAQLYTEHMVDKDIPDVIIFQGIDLWQQYCEQEKPIVKKVETYAAALEYYVHKTLLDNNTVTQGQIAEEYGTTPGTVSTNYRKLAAVLDE